MQTQQSARDLVGQAVQALRQARNSGDIPEGHKARVLFALQHLDKIPWPRFRPEDRPRCERGCMED